MLEMADHDILPAVSAYCDTLTERLSHRAGRYEQETLALLNKLLDDAYDARCRLEKALEHTAGGADEHAADLYRDEVLPAMRSQRDAADAMEVRMPANAWPFPSYGELLFSVK